MKAGEWITPIWGAVLLSLVSGPFAAGAETVTLLPAADTTLMEISPDNNFGSGGTFTAGGRSDGGRNRALLWFDIANNVPAGATINSVTLRVTVIAARGPNSIFDLHELLAPWNEGAGADYGLGSPALPGEVTWNDRLAPDTSWLMAGGDFVNSPSASVFIGGQANYTFLSTSALVDDVQGWLNNPASNFGWLLRSESENTPGTIRRFGSRQAGASAPALTIEFTPIPEPGPVGLLGLGLVALAALARRR